MKKKSAADSRKKPAPVKPDGLWETLEARFRNHPERHPGMEWETVRTRLEARPEKRRSLEAMEQTGGEPDVTGSDAATGEIIFSDCSPESPKGRISVCYDREALESRKEHQPKTSAVDMAAGMGVELMTEDEFHALQQLGEFDTKTSSWLKTPPEIRRRGGAIFGDRRFGRVFIYHNGAQSYYSARGFRATLRV